VARSDLSTEVAAPQPLVYRLLQRLVAVRAEEAQAVLWCWLYIFAVLSSYYIMRPIREQMGVAGGVNNLKWLFAGTLAGMILLNLPFAYLVKTLPRSRFIPLTYRFFAANILLFAVALALADPAQTIWIGRTFFIWISVYNLFVVSVFWQLNVDLFTPEQGKRLFGFVAAGATIGAMAGSAVTASLARLVSPTTLLIGAALLLEVAVFSVGRLARLSPALHRHPAADPAEKAAERPLGGSVVAGISNVLRSPYLLVVSVFLLLFAITSTFLYVQQAVIAHDNFADRGAQTQFFGTIDFAVNTLTLVVSLFLTGRIIARLGIAATLAILPVVTMVGFGALVLAPTLAVFAVLQVTRRAGDYAITRPAREVLFTVLPREDRYKSKGFIDTVVYRAGDQMGVWAVSELNKLGASLAAFCAIGLAAVWLVSALWLGYRQRTLEAAPLPAAGD